MKAVLPVNLMDTLVDPCANPEEGSSDVYIRHVVKRALRHALAFKDLREIEAEDLWQELGFPMRKWA